MILLRNFWQPLKSVQSAVIIMNMGSTVTMTIMRTIMTIMRTIMTMKTIAIMIIMRTIMAMKVTVTTTTTIIMPMRCLQVGAVRP